MPAYKLTDRNGHTRRGRPGETLWRVNEIVRPTGVGNLPCGPGVLHAYSTPEVGVLANPIHANFFEPRCFRVEIVGGYWRAGGLKRWTESCLRVVEEVDVPDIPLLTRVAWAVVLVPHSSTRGWAVGWLSGEDRTQDAAAQAEAWAAKAARVWAAEAWAARAAAAVPAEAARVWAAEAEAARAAKAARVWAARAARTAAAVPAEAAAAAAAAAEAARAAAEAWAARAAAAVPAEAADPFAYEALLMPALHRAKAILAGRFPAERFDETLETPTLG